MLKLIMIINEIDSECVGYDFNIEEDEATNLEKIAVNNVLDALDDMADRINENDAKSTVKGILDNLGKQT